VAGLELALVDVNSQRHDGGPDVEVVGEGEDGEVEIACSHHGTTAHLIILPGDTGPDYFTDVSVHFLNFASRSRQPHIWKGGPKIHTYLCIYVCIVTIYTPREKTIY
jgi:hypothetical protein